MFYHSGVFEFDAAEVRRRAEGLSQLQLLRVITLKKGKLRDEALAIYREAFEERFGPLVDLLERAEVLVGEVELEVGGVERLGDLGSARDPCHGVLVGSDRGLGFRALAVLQDEMSAALEGGFGVAGRIASELGARGWPRPDVAGSLPFPLPLVAELDDGQSTWEPLTRLSGAEVSTSGPGHVLVSILRQDGRRLTFRIPATAWTELEAWLNAHALEVVRKKTLLERMRGYWRDGG